MFWFHCESEDSSINLNLVSEIYWNYELHDGHGGKVTRLLFLQTTTEYSDTTTPYVDISDKSDRKRLRDKIVGDAQEWAKYI